jgi:hypothetical protein
MLTRRPVHVLQPHIDEYSRQGSDDLSFRTLRLWGSQLPLIPNSLLVPIASPHYVRFRMEDGGKCVTVHIATYWLKQRAERDGKSAADLRLLCSFYRDEIEAAASAKYDQSYYHGADVVVVSSDLE